MIEFFIENNVIGFFFFFLIGLFFGSVFVFLLKFLDTNIAKKTSTKLDDLLIKSVKKPGYFLIVLTGFYFGLNQLLFLNEFVFFIDSIFFVLLVVLFSLLFSNLVNSVLVVWSKEKKHNKSPQLINKLLTAIIFLTGFLIILVYFEVEITPLLATLGIGGLAIGLALQGTLSNFFAGVHILSDKPIKVGDFIELDDGKTMGFVEDIGWRSTRIKTFANTIIIIPNGKLSESIIVNDSLPSLELSVYVDCGVSYLSDLNKVEKIVLKTAKKIQKSIPGAIKEFEPVMRFKEFGDSNINFFVVLRVQDVSSRFFVRHEFIKELKKAFNENKIEISWPVRKIYQA